MMIFFLSPEEKIYARYGGRNANDPDAFQSPSGLNYTMQSVLKMHKSEEKLFAARKYEKTITIRDLQNSTKMTTRRRGRCLHCHDVKELKYRELYNKGKWTRDQVVWRYPVPEKVGMSMKVDEGNILKSVLKASSAGNAGLQKGDQLQVVNEVPIHSIHDVQYALDRALTKKQIEIRWLRDGKSMTAKLSLPQSWFKGDIGWRPSVWGLVPSLHVDGDDLTESEKLMLGLHPKQTAFRHQERVHSHAKKAGIQAGDIILGVDGKKMQFKVLDVLRYVSREYIVDDEIIINVLRDGKHLKIPMTLIR